MKKQTAIICDIDGVLCNSDVRYKVIDFEAFNSGDLRAFYDSLNAYNNYHIDDDYPIELGLALLNGLLDKLHPDHLIYLTARGDGSYDTTLEWLQKHGLMQSEAETLMMKVDDFSGNKKFLWDQEFKKQAAKKLLKRYEVLCAIDDKLANCEAFESLGIPYIHFKMPRIDL